MITKLVDFIKENNTNSAIDWSILDDMYGSISDYYNLYTGGYRIKDLGKKFDISDVNHYLGDSTYNESELFELDTIFKTVTNGSGISLDEVYNLINQFHLLLDEGHPVSNNISEEDLKDMNDELKSNGLRGFTNMETYTKSLNNLLKIMKMYF